MVFVKNSYLEKPDKKVCSILPKIFIFETMLIWPVFWPVFQDMNFQQTPL